MFHRLIRLKNKCLMTKKEVGWRYGRIEVRARIPHGKGVWPAIWTLGTNIPDRLCPRLQRVGRPTQYFVKRRPAPLTDPGVGVDVGAALE
jgi:hypothetical protein